ncbi:hypothetical protein [Natrinema sp. H-ect4]|uniref:hypothetical protein n=1 Tax=Natrinema sp. H-ect4 TaxID=3242699 RepID=UPI0035A826FC
MSDYTVVEKNQLQRFRNYVALLCTLLGASAVSFAIGIFTGTEVAFFLAILYLIGVVGIWHLFRDDFSNISQAIEDAEDGDSE